MSGPEFLGLEDVPYTVADQAWLEAQRRADMNGSGAVTELRERPWRSERWSEFRETADEEIRWLAEGLIPEGAFAFVAAPPKKGKTWLAIHLALCLATGATLWEEFQVPQAVPGLYVALEGSRAALRARTGALARGLELDPESEALENLHYLYRPRPFDLARHESAAWLEEQAGELEARFVVIDVLRAAARFREDKAEDFAVIRDSFEPMLRDGVTIIVLHHFAKLTDTQRDRSPGERMSGTGAMYGALDVGLLITQSEDGARRLRVDVDARDFAAPDALGLVLEGSGSGAHGGFTYTDTARFMVDASAAAERDLVGELERLYADGKWRTLKELSAPKDVGGLAAAEDVLKYALETHPSRFWRIPDSDGAKAVGRAPQARPWGTVKMAEELRYGPIAVPTLLDAATDSTSGEELLPPKGVSSSSSEDGRTATEVPNAVPKKPKIDL